MAPDDLISRVGDIGVFITLGIVGVVRVVTTFLIVVFTIISSIDLFSLSSELN